MFKAHFFAQYFTLLSSKNRKELCVIVEHVASCTISYNTGCFTFVPCV